MTSEEIIFNGSIKDVKVAIKEIFQKNKYKTEWKSDDEGMATRDTVLMGFIKAHSCIPFKIHADNKEMTALELFYKVDHIGVMWVFGIIPGLIFSYWTYNKIVREFKYIKRKYMENNDIMNSYQK